MEQRNPKILAIILTLIFFILIWLLVREFPILSNTIKGKYLVIGSMLTGLLLSAAFILRFRERFTPWDKHRPDVALIVVSTMFFSPLVGSWLNRGLGKHEFQKFTFVSETPFYASGYGFLQGDKTKVSGYHLLVKQNGKQYRFKYKSQAFYPLTKPEAGIMLPICNGFLGARVMLLK